MSECSQLLRSQGKPFSRTCGLCRYGPCVKRDEIALGWTLVERMQAAHVGSCTCNTRTPHVPAHNPMCHYRLFAEAISALEARR